MKTQQECYEALLRGEKLRRIGADPGCYVHFVEGRIVDQDGHPCSWNFCWPKKWEIWTPSKHRVWVNLYIPSELRAVGGLILRTRGEYYETQEEAIKHALSHCVGQSLIKVPEDKP